LQRERRTGSAVDHWTDVRVLVELAEEFPRHLVVTNLGKLERNTSATILWVALLEGVECVSDRIEHGILRLTSWLTVCDGNDQYWLPELTGSGFLEHYLVNDLLAD
jgi:hypothetical protein